MSEIIINPNAPVTLKQDYVGTIFNTMRTIAGYRQVFFDLEAAKQSNGVNEVTATDIEKICDAQQDLIQEMVDFILYGENNGST